MKEFTTDQFFDVSQFSHQELFECGEYAWEALSFLNEFLLGLEKQVLSPIPNGVHLENVDLIAIGKNTTIEPGSYIKGPCVIGDNCEIRHGAYIRGDVLIGNDCVIGHCSEVKHSIFLNGATAGHFNYVGDSILGNRVNLGAGVKCANLRLDRSEVILGGVRTGLEKLGVILGDEVQLGCNVVTNPGTLIGRNTLARANLTLQGVIPAFSRIKAKQQPVVTTYVDRNRV